MTTIKVEQLMNGMFVRVLQKIAAAPIDLYAARRIKNLAAAIYEKQSEIRHRYVEEIKKIYADRDEAGNIIPDEAGTGFKVKDTEAFDKASSEFGNQEVFIPGNRLRFEDLAQIKMSASEIEILTPVLEEPKNSD